MISKELQIFLLILISIASIGLKLYFKSGKWVNAENVKS